MHGLTAKQREIVEYIKSYIEIHHYSPTLEEIKTHFSYSSLSTIHEHLLALKRKQAISFEKGSKRGITIKQEKSSSSSPFQIPLIGQFSSGLPLELFEKEPALYQLSHESSENHAIYALKVHGNGLINDLIYNQDLLIIEAKTTLLNQEIGLISLKSGPSYIKKYFDEGDTVRLESLNPLGFSLSETFKKEEILIRGKLLLLIRDFNL